MTSCTTSVGEKNGWLHLSANDFTYSSPTLKAKLTQQKSQAITPVTASSIGQPRSTPELLLKNGIKYYAEKLRSDPLGIPFKGMDTSCAVDLRKDAAIGYPQVISTEVVRESAGASGSLLFNYQVGTYHITFCGQVPQTMDFEILGGSDPLNPVIAQSAKVTTPASLIKKSITCVKGKTIKKVTAVNPKCPVGYKKK